jgi:hypothetical protein
MEYLIRNIRWKENVVLPWQKGILAGINSLRDLMKEFHKEGYKYICTRKLNQDPCENVFSQVRELSHNSRPDQLDFLQRMTVIMLIRNEANLLIPEGANVEVEPVVNDKEETLNSAEPPEKVVVTTGTTPSTEYILDNDEMDERTVKPPIRKNFEAEGMEYVAGYIAHKIGKYKI